MALKPNKVQYIPASEVFEDRPFAKGALEDSGAFSYGENDISLVVRDKLIAALKELELQYGDEEEEVDQAIAFLETLPATMYIDLEDM